MDSALADWALILGVLALVLLTYWFIGRFIDGLVDYWRWYRDKDGECQRCDGKGCVACDARYVEQL